MQTRTTLDDIVHRKTEGEGLAIAGLSRGARVHLARGGLSLSSGYKLGLCQRKEFTKFSSIDKISG